MLSSYRADWVLPIAGPPIRGGWVGIENGRVGGIGAQAPAGAVDLGRVAILPALVNAHTHLELSYLHRLVLPSEHFNDWIAELMATRRRFPNPSDPIILDAVREGIRQARSTGTGLVGDVSNTLVTVPLLREAGLMGQVFYELIGFNAPDPIERVRQARETAGAAGLSEKGVRVSLAPHAPYSVSPGLFMAIRADLDEHPEQVSTVHLGESAHEVEFLKHGTGTVRAMLERLGVWTSEWRVPDASPVGYLLDLGFLDRRVLVVHGVQLTDEDLARLAAAGVVIVSCPRSNRYVGVGAAPLQRFFAAGVSVALGTDSLASVEDLNMFSELAAARRLAPQIPARRLLESATLTGARALGFGEELGSIAVGKRAALVKVSLPSAAVSDVEEYLVSGVEPGAIEWLDEVAR